MSQDKLQALDGILAEIFPEEPLTSSNAVPPPITASSEPSGDEPPVQDPAIEPPKDASDPVTIAEHARAVLAAQSLDTAIRLRWAIRDIKAGRTKLSPIDPNDLAALIDLGFVEMRDGTPMLTCTGNLAINHEPTEMKANEKRVERASNVAALPPWPWKPNL
jgi:hypothetical protein